MSNRMSDNRSDRSIFLFVGLTLALLAASIMVIINKGIPNLQDIFEPEYSSSSSAIHTKSIPQQPSPMPGTDISSATSLVQPTMPSGVVSSTPTVIPGGILPPMTSTPVVTTTTCAGLNALDRQFLDQAQQNTFNVSTAQADFDLSFSTTSNGQTQAIKVSGSGVYTGVQDLHNLSGQFNLQIDITTLDQTQSALVDVIFVASTLYIRGSGPGTSGETTSWIGISFGDFIDSNLVNSLSPESALQITDGTGAIMGMPECDLSAVSNPSELFNLFDFGSYICTSRQTGDGMGPSVFRTDVDLAHFIQSPNFPAMMTNLFTFCNLADQSADMSGALVQIAQFALLNPSLYVERQISADNTYLSRAVLQLSGTLDASQLGDPSTPPVDLDIRASVNVSNFNQPPNISAPEGAQIIGVGDFNQMFQAQAPTHQN